MKRLLVVFMFGFLCLANLALAQVKSIDCNKDPDVSGLGLTIENHQQDGTYQLDPSNIKTFSFESKTTPTKGADMLKKLNKTGLNACVMDFLMSHKELIPETWKAKQIVFPGTIFKDAGGNECLRFIYWWDNQWNTGSLYLSESYDDKIAAIK